jgi:hypothetical protein
MHQSELAPIGLHRHNRNIFVVIKGILHWVRRHLIIFKFAIECRGGVSNICLRRILSISAYHSTYGSETMAHPQCWDNLGHRCSADGPSRFTLYLTVLTFKLPYLTPSLRLPGLRKSNLIWGILTLTTSTPVDDEWLIWCQWTTSPNYK